jgi:hypothetical protein
LLGQALTAAGHGARGNAETAAAGATFDRLELPSPPQTAAMPPSPPAREVRAGSTAEEHRFCREGDYWSVVFDGRTTRLRDAKGLRYLARLLTQPGREIHAIDLVIEDERAASPHDGDVDREASRALSRDAGEVLDRRAKEAYRRRLAEIESDLEEARQCGDAYRTEQASVRCPLQPRSNTVFYRDPRRYTSLLRKVVNGSALLRVGVSQHAPPESISERTIRACLSASPAHQPPEPAASMRMA